MKLRSLGILLIFVGGSLILLGVAERLGLLGGQYSPQSLPPRALVHAPHWWSTTTLGCLLTIVGTFSWIQGRRKKTLKGTQWAFAFAGLFVCMLVIAFPPWIFRFRATPPSVSDEPAGYHFLFNPPPVPITGSIPSYEDPFVEVQLYGRWRRDIWKPAVNRPRLVIQLLVVIALTVSAISVAGTSSCQGQRDPQSRP